ncbi:unnamed protein product [Alternaria alternata]
MQRRAGKFFDSALFSDDERTHIERKLDARSYKEPVKESKSGMKSEFGMMEMGKLKTEAHGFDDDSKGLSDKSSFRYGQPSHSRTSTEAQDTVQNFIEQFVRMLCERSGTGIYRDITTIRRSQEYSMQALEEALGVYATQLLSVTAAVINKSVGGVKRDDTIMLFGAVLIQHYKFPIAHCFRECLSGVRALENPNAKFTLQQMGPPNFSPTLLGLTEKPMIVLDKSTMDHPLFISAINVVELSEYLESKITALELNDMMRLLGSADEMQLLAPCVRRSLYLDTNSAMQIIEAMMSEENLLHSGGHHYEAEIHLPWWSIENFMIDEYEEDYEEDIPPFGSDEETPLSYQDGISCCGPRARLHEVGLQDLSLLRAIVGWCSVATTCLGSTHAKYENIDYTKATEANSAPRCTGTSFGFQQFGVAALDVKFGLKDGKSHFQRAGPYRRIVQLADSSPIVLHDIEDKRSWLVPATNVMLHIVQHRHHLDPFQVNGQSISLDTNISRGSSAKNVLLKNRDQVLYEDDKHTFMNEILDIWSTLEFLLAQNISREREAPGLPIPSSFHGSLYGFEFKAIVNQDAPYNLKKTSIKRTHGGWKKLIEDIDALVLFANGLGDVILPAGEHNQDLCSRWRKVPHGQDYLATTTNMLQTLFDKAGSREDQEYLTTKSKIRWHQGSNALFDVCQNPDLCDCTRVQQLVPESAMRTVQRPTSIASEGAVVFGRPEPRRAPPRPAEPHNSNSLYSQPNVPIVPRMVRRRGSTDDERRVRIRRLDVEVEESSRERNHQLQAIS